MSVAKNMFFSVVMMFIVAGVGAPAIAADVDQQRLQDIIKQSEIEIAGLSLAVALGDELVFDGAAGCAQFNDNSDKKCRRPMKSTTKVRVASISKMITAFAALKLVEDDVLDLDEDVSSYLGWSLRNPAYPDSPITVRHLLTHTSSLRDPETYWIEAPQKFDPYIRSLPEIFAVSGGENNYAPGAYFSYSNLGFGLLASVMERAAGKRFDEIVRHTVTDPLDLDAGFNWSGVSKKVRRRGATLYRKVNGVWEPQIDDEPVLRSRAPFFLSEDDLNIDEYLEAYDPGDNGSLFSPQGGLRASVVDLVKLLQLLKDDGHRGASTPVWKFDSENLNGDTDGNFFQAYGLGVQTLVDGQSVFDGHQLIGHPGEAYGLYSGAWVVKSDGAGDDEISFAFAVTGTPQRPRAGAYSGFNNLEEKLVVLAKEIASNALEARYSGDGLRPFDETRNASFDIAAAQATARAKGTNVLLILGGNWCHDSRGLAGKMRRPELAALIADQYELVYVDLGHRERNLDIAPRFGVTQLHGTPVVLILSSEGVLLNKESVHDWRSAASISYDETLAYFRSFAPKAK